MKIPRLSPLVMVILAVLAYMYLWPMVRGRLMPGGAA